MIFLFAAIGFWRFWKGMTAAGPPPKKGFIPALFSTIGQIFSHTRFTKCEANRARWIGHLLLFFGFVGAMITTACIFIFIFLPHYLHLLGVESLDAFFELPIELPHPVKILGAVSGIMLVVGGGWLIIRRWANKDDVGANGYADYLFLYMLFFVGLTGMLSWLTRLSGVALLAYIVYFLHLLVVFFLLWYMPYSKFAHMIYRTLGLTYANMIGREPREK
jgi:quinone-modifying oxidoreductase subunit QmoC